MSLIVAALLTVGVGIVHSWLGEVRLIGPLLAPASRQGVLAKSEFSRGVLRFAWHITTIAWWGMAAILAASAMAPLEPQGRLAVALISATFAVTGLITLAASRGRHLAWPVFLAIAALSIVPLI